jgi:hypothetical protein
MHHAALAGQEVQLRAPAGAVLVRPYVPCCDHERWNAFVDRSKNGTFLHRRDFLEYHQHRFADASQLVFDEEGLLALFPAHRDHDHLVSHAGLSYGALVTDARMTAVRMLQVFDELRTHLLRTGIRQVSYKTIPYIYHRTPADEDLYALFRAGARLARRDLLTVVDRQGRLPMRSGRCDGHRKALRAGVRVLEGTDYAAFWRVLEAHLRERYDAAPVHSLAEIELLASRFPGAVRLHVALDGDEVVAGCVVFASTQVAHVQYIAADARGRRVGALDKLFFELIEDVYAGWRYFDFGASTLRQGRELNEGLAFQKEGFGGRTVVHDFYEWDLDGPR